MEYGNAVLFLRKLQNIGRKHEEIRKNLPISMKNTIFPIEKLQIIV